MSLNVKRYFAPTARDALRRLKDELGPDAIVLSNRSVEGGVEIMALPAEEAETLQQAAGERRAPPAPRRSPEFAPWQPPVAGAADDDFTVSLSGALPKRPQQHAAVRQAAPARQSAPARDDRPRDAAPAREAAAPEAGAPAHQPARGAPAESASESQLMRELRAIKGLIEQQLAGFAWGDMARAAPARTQLLTEMLDAGFSAQLARRLIDSLQEDTNIGEARKALKAQLNRGLMTVDSDADIIDRGGVYALVGPTGVGKTTTTAKLAARCVVRHGADKLALLTTDSYRIGAHEQLRIYGRILGVPVHAVRDAAHLRQTLGELRNKHMILIDTVGMSQRDRMVGEQAAMFMNAGEVRRLLLLNATVRGDTLDDVMRAYAGPDLAGAILTKVDEAVSLAPALDVLIRNALDLFYVANGQRVPEDLHLPNRAYLLHRALKESPEDSPHRLSGDEAGLLLGALATRGIALGASLG